MNELLKDRTPFEYILYYMSNEKTFRNMISTFAAVIILFEFGLPILWGDSYSYKRFDLMWTHVWIGLIVFINLYLIEKQYKYLSEIKITDDNQAKTLLLIFGHSLYSILMPLLTSLFAMISISTFHYELFSIVVGSLASLAMLLSFASLWQNLNELITLSTILVNQNKE